MTAGVPQGSILGPLLWTMAYADVLELFSLEGVQTLAYADDLAVLATARDEDTLQRKVQAVLERINEWIEGHGLQLAPEKSEAVLLIGKKKLHREINLALNGVKIEIKGSARYLGVTVDRAL